LAFGITVHTNLDEVHEGGYSNQFLTGVLCQCAVVVVSGFMGLGGGGGGPMVGFWRVCVAPPSMCSGFAGSGDRRGPRSCTCIHFIFYFMLVPMEEKQFIV
jgi:hypothetical protein